MFVVVIVVVDDGVKDGVVVVVVVDSDNSGVFIVPAVPISCYGIPVNLQLNSPHGIGWSPSTSSQKWSISVYSRVSAHTFLTTFGLFIGSYLFAFSSNSFGCFSV